MNTWALAVLISAPNLLTLFYHMVAVKEHFAYFLSETENLCALVPAVIDVMVLF